MNCPKCNHEQNAENTECDRCGIIFAKYHSAMDSKLKEMKSITSGSSAMDIKPSITIGEIFFFTRPESNIIFFYGRAILLIILLLWGFKFLASPLANNDAGESFMHLVNLPFHEAGHIVFRPFGSFMASLGGSLGQLMMPLICLSVLLIKTRDTFGSSVALWWFGQNLVDIAPYINDARSLSLPLLGGNIGRSSPYGFHDWQYLLTESGLLQYDHFLAKSCLTIGAIVFLISFVWGATLLIKQHRQMAD